MYKEIREELNLPPARRARALKSSLSQDLLIVDPRDQSVETSKSPSPPKQHHSTTGLSAPFSLLNNGFKNKYDTKVETTLAHDGKMGIKLKNRHAAEGASKILKKAHGHSASVPALGNQEQSRSPGKDILETYYALPKDTTK